MRDFLRSLRLIFAQSSRDLLLSRKALLFFGASLLFVGIHVVGFSQAGDRANQDDLFAGITVFVLWQAVMPLTAMYFAIAAIREEIAHRTLVYLLSAPVPRPAIWLGKFLAASLVAACVLLTAYGGSALVAATSAEDAYNGVDGQTLLAPLLPLCLGVLAYAGIGTMLALVFKRPMIAGAIYVIGWEQFVGSTPGQAGVRSLTVVDSVRTMFWHGIPAAGGVRRDLMQWRGHGESVTMPPCEDAMRALLWLTAGALAIGLALAARKDYESAPKD